MPNRWMASRSVFVICPALLGALVNLALAQEYPARPLRVIVPFPPSGGGDIVARAVGQKLSESWNQSVVIDNRPAAAGIVGTDLAAKSAADGYTLLVTGPGPLVIAPTMYPNLPYDVARDFAPITMAVSYPYLLVAHPAMPARTIKELIALAKSQPGKLNVAFGGLATPPHLAVELFNMMAGVRMVAIPYKGTGPALIDVLGGHVELIFGNVPSQLGHVKSGKLRALGITTMRRSDLLPDVPTIDEAGVPGFEVSAWVGWLAPAGTPLPIVTKLHKEIDRSVHAPDMKNRFLSEGAEPSGVPPKQFAAHMKAETAKWARVIKAAGIKPQ